MILESKNLRLKIYNQNVLVEHPEMIAMMICSDGIGETTQKMPTC